VVATLHEREIDHCRCHVKVNAVSSRAVHWPQRSYPWQSLVYGPKRRTFKALYSSSSFNRAEPYKAGRIWSVNLQEVLHTRMVLGIRQEGYFSAALANEVFWPCQPDYTSVHSRCYVYWALEGDYVDLSIWNGVANIFLSSFVAPHLPYLHTCAYTPVGGDVHG